MHVKKSLAEAAFWQICITGPSEVDPANDVVLSETNEMAVQVFHGWHLKKEFACFIG